MKKFFTLFLLSLSALAANAQSSYPGNGKAGFGGPVGMGILNISTSGTDITFTLNKGTGDMNDALVIYMDGAAGGFTTTSGFMDVSTPLMRAISGFDGTNRATFNFSSAFAPELALAIMPNTSQGAVFVYLNNAAHTPLMSPVLTNNGSTSASTYSVTVNTAVLGVTGPFTFQFIGTYISGTGYRSDEAIGDSMTGFVQGWNPYTSTASPLVYSGTFPVTLSKFTGVLKDESAVLSWETKTESNSKAYEIERSTKGDTWVSAGKIESQNKPNGATYTFIDKTGIDNTIYYRLKMIDKDGSYKNSNVILLSKSRKPKITLMGNPVKDQIRVNIGSDRQRKYRVQLFSPDGKRISTNNMTLNAGINNVVVPIPASIKGTSILKISDGVDETVIPVLID